VLVHPEPELLAGSNPCRQRGQSGLFIQGDQDIEFFGEQGKRRFKVKGPNSIEIGIAEEEVSAFCIRKPRDVALGVFPLQSGKKRRRTQDVALGPALDDEYPGWKGGEMGASFAETPEGTWFIAEKVDAIRLQCHAASSPSRRPILIYATKQEAMTRRIPEFR